MEYGTVPEPMFRAGRASVLRALEAMPRLYRTEAGHEHWEARARENLARELADLGA
jgi:predicted metal-dependent HD superfamily phosphohydrolase